METATICKEVIERYPFGIIFSKTAPDYCRRFISPDISSPNQGSASTQSASSADENEESQSPLIIDYDKDFCYFYFSSSFESNILLQRRQMCDGKTNAKRDFADYIDYFNDDLRVMREYNNGKILCLCEPWRPPGIASFVYTRKTALHCDDGSSYMLGAFGLVDDIVLGIAKFRRIPYSFDGILAPAGDITIPDQWFYEAVLSLPVGMIIFNDSDEPVIRNNLSKSINPVLSMQDVSNLFHPYNFSVDSNSLLSNAAWISNCFDALDVGIYGIMVSSKIMKVVVLRPTLAASEVSPSKWKAILD